MSENILKKVWPHLFAIVLFIIIAFVYFSPVLDGKTISGHDNKSSSGISKEIADFRTEFNEEPLWTNSMFGGMPAYLVSFAKPEIVLPQIDGFLKVGPRPVHFLFLYLIGFYILLLSFHVNPWISILGAIAFAFSSYFLVIIHAGHTSKAVAIGYMPAIIGGVYLGLRGKYLLGAAITGLFLALQLRAGHLQITYYTLLIILILVIVTSVYAIKEKQIKQLLIGGSLLLISAIIAVGANATTLWTTYEYSKYSMRGKSELTFDKEDQTSGLDKSYATDWSYGIAETFTLLIPNFHGGGSADGMLSENSEVFKLFERAQGKTSAKRVIKQPFPLYWGPQPGTSGPVYVGAIVVFLFVFSLFVIKGKLKWWILIATALSIMLSWGRNFSLLTNFFLDHFPGYSKFRTVSMSLVMAELTIPLLAFIGLHKLLTDSANRKKYLPYLKYSLFITGGLALFWILFNGLFFSFSSNSDGYMQQEIVDALLIDRQALLRKDAFRSLVFVFLASGIVYLFVKNKLKTSYFIAGLGLLIIIDMWPIDKRYINNDDFVPRRQAQTPFGPTKADEFILQDKDPNYRVLNLAVNTFNDASTSYFHKSIGGYHGAKMKRYQELIEYHIHKNIQNLANTFNSNPSPMAIDSTMANLGVLNMLNTRYIIYNAEAAPLVNRHAYGNAWFTDDVIIVENADQEIKKLYNINPGETALIDKRFSEIIEGLNIKRDSLAQIALMEYKPNYLKYQSSAASPQLAVFSEIYYYKGWQASIDGNPAPHFRTNYVLRGLVIPEGQHLIEFKFKPNSYFLGKKISLAGSSILILLFIGVITMEIIKSFKKDDRNQ